MVVPVVVVPVVVVPVVRGAGGGAGGIWRLQLQAEAARQLDADGPRLVSIHFQQRHVDNHLRTRLIQVVDELLRQQQLVRRGAHDDGALARHAVELGIHQQVAQRGLNIVQIVLLGGVGQIERLHRLFFQFLALGAGIHGDKDGVGGHRVPERARDCANDAQGIQ